MSTNLPMKKDEGIMEKIKSFFRNIFHKNEVKNVNEAEKISNENEIKIENNFSDKLVNNGTEQKKNKYDIAREKEQFIKNIEKNPKILYELPIEKLKMLETYYDESISDLKIELNKLKKVG